jgi:hypothetical protein
MGMRKPSFYRLLNPPEQLLVTRVFGNTLPPWVEIGIGDGLGFGGAPWASTGNAGYPQTPNVRYMINVGDLAAHNLTSPNGTSAVLGDSYGTICGLLLHEMTHIWQYFRGEGVVLGKIHAETLGGYDFEVGAPWNDYNTEQQASIVETWHDRGGKETDELFPYIRDVVRKGLRKDHWRREVPLRDYELYNNGIQPLPASTLKVVIYFPENVIEEHLARRFQATDVKGYTGRLEKLKEIFWRVPSKQAKDLVERLKSYNTRDKLSKYFREHLSTFERETLLKVLRENAAKGSS